MHNTLKITRNTYLNDAKSYKKFSISIKESTLNALDGVVKETHRSRNEIINMLLEFGIANLEITDEQQ